MLAKFKATGFVTKVVLAVALFFAVTSSRSCAARPAGDDAVASASADIERIVGNTVEIRPEPAMARDPALPAVCKMLAGGFHDAASAADMRAHMAHIVHEIVIERFTTHGAPRWVTMQKGVMTVQTLTDPAGIEHLRPLIVQVLKEKVQMMAKPKE